MSENNRLKIIGHRGAAGLIAENTIESIMKAVSLQVDCIEIDVWKTKDNEIIVFHDAYLDRLTGESGFIKEMDYSGIRKASLKNNEHIPTLHEVISAIKGTAVQLLVEVKSEDALESAVKILLEELPAHRFIVGSFFHGGIKELKQAMPEIQTSVMFECVPVGVDEYLKSVNPDYVTISIETYNDDLIEIIKAQDRKLVFYTINIRPEMELAMKAAPYAIITNFPDLFDKNGNYTGG